MKINIGDTFWYNDGSSYPEVATIFDKKVNSIHLQIKYPFIAKYTAINILDIEKCLFNSKEKSFLSYIERNKIPFDLKGAYILLTQKVLDEKLKPEQMNEMFVFIWEKITIKD